MRDFKIGLHLGISDAATMLSRIRQADAAGLDMAWSTVGGIAPDPIVVFGRASQETERIGLGTSIVPTYPRHPIALAQAAMALEQLAPGRLRLGVGPSHASIVGGIYGLPFERPQAHLREYIGILRAVLETGRVDFDGELLSAHGQISAPTPVPILAGALRPRAFRLCGEITDGAISWMCPLPYIRDTALPAVAEGAQAAGRERPPLVVHAPVVVWDDPDAVRAGGAEGFGGYQRWPYYERMMRDAGLEDAAGDVFTDAMADALIISGDEDQVAARIRALPGFGASELLADICPVGEATGRAWDRTVELLGQLARAD